MEQQVKTKVQFTDNYDAFTNLENNDSLSTGFGKLHYDLGYLNSEDQRQESEINAIAQAGSKNICPIGTETHTSQIGFGTEYSFPMPEGAYIISFTGTMVAPIQFNVYSESGTRIALVDIHTIQEAEAGIRFVLNDNATKCKFWYDTSDAYTLSNIMIRDASITDNTYQPYSPTNRELYNALGEKQDTISDLSTIRSGATLGATSVQDIQINGTTQTKTSGVVNLPAYPPNMVVLSYGSSTWDDFIAAYQTNTVVYCRASSNSNPATGSQTRLAFLAYVNDPANPTEVEFQYYRSVSSKSDTNQGDEVYVYKLNKTNGWSNLKRNTYSKVAVTTPISKSYTSGTITLSHEDSGATAGTYDSVTVDAKGHVTAGTTYTISQAEQDAEIAVIANAGAKNFLNPNLKSKTVDGVTYTLQSDGRIIANGTAASASLVASFYGGQFTIPAGDWLLNGCPSGGSTASYMVQIKDNSHPESPADGTVLYRDFGTGDVLISISTETAFMYVIRVANGYTANSLIFKPMIRPSAITDPTYVPYALPNPTLTPAAIKAVDEGAKNLVAWDIPTVRSLNSNATWTSDDTCVKGGITYKFNTDGTVVANGTADTSGSKYIKLKSNFSVTRGLIASCGLPDVSQNQSKGLLQLDYPTGSDLNVYDYDGSKEVDRDGTVELYITVLGGITVSNLIFRPMLCTAADYAISKAYAPYAKTNRELTVAEDEDRAALAEVIDGGAAGTKNLLDCSLQSIKAVTQNPAYGFSWNGNVCTSTRGASFTINADNSITVAATNMQNDVWFKLTDFMYSAGSYVISGCPTNGSTRSYYIESDALNYRDIGNGVSFTINSTTTDSIYIIVKTGQTFEKTFYPMLCPKVLYDACQSYVPYAPALTNNILTPALIKQVDGGAKNYAKESETTETTATWLGQILVSPLQGECVFSATTTWESGLCDLYGYERGGTRTHLGTVTVSNYKIIQKYTTDKDFIYVQIYYNNATAKKLTNVMLCTAADWAVSQKFVPYAPTNRELYEGKTNEVSISIKSNLDDTFVDKNNSDITIFKHGELCIARVTLKTITTALTGADILTSTAIPSEYRPTYTVYETVSSRNVGGWASSTITCSVMSVETDGNIILRTGTNAASSLYVIGTLIWHL